jgi:hypothetical protein
MPNGMRRAPGDVVTRYRRPPATFPRADVFLRFGGSFTRRLDSESRSALDGGSSGFDGAALDGGSSGFDGAALDGGSSGFDVDGAIIPGA